MDFRDRYQDALEDAAELDSWRRDASRLLCSWHQRENVPDATPDEIEVVAMFQRCDLCERLTEVRWTPSRERLARVAAQLLSPPD
jgi:hypothetical protein